MVVMMMIMFSHGSNRKRGSVLFIFNLLLRLVKIAEEHIKHLASNNDAIIYICCITVDKPSGPPV